MPVRFTKCVKSGGRVRTVKPKGKKSSSYVHVCYPKGGGSSVSGELKHRKSASASRRGGRKR